MTSAVRRKAIIVNCSNRNIDMLSFKNWLEKYGNESCDGCFYNIPHRAKCTYKGTCARFDAYKESQRRLRTEKLS